MDISSPTHEGVTSIDISDCDVRIVFFFFSTITGWKKIDSNRIASKKIKKKTMAR